MAYISSIICFTEYSTRLDQRQATGGQEGEVVSKLKKNNQEICVGCDELLGEIGKGLASYYCECSKVGPYCLDCWEDHKIVCSTASEIDGEEEG